MSGQIQKKKQESKPAPAESAPQEAKDLRNEELAADVDDLLDEIDAILEENAEEFVKAYIQKGGE